MLCCVLPLILLGVIRRMLRLDARGPSPMPPPAYRDATATQSTERAEAGAR